MMTVRSCRAAIPHLQRGGGGRVVVTASMSTRVPRPALVPYVAMKGAIATLAKNLALEFGKDAIRVNCVCPGAVLTEVMGSALAKAVATYGEPADAAFDRYARENWGMKVALDRVGRARERVDALDATGYYFPGYPKAPTDDSATTPGAAGAAPGNRAA